MWRRTRGEKIRSNGITEEGGKEVKEIKEVKELKFAQPCMHVACAVCWEVRIRIGDLR